MAVTANRAVVTGSWVAGERPQWWPLLVREMQYLMEIRESLEGPGSWSV
ncbi:MAG: hypothetical protein GX131_05300 [candidate division WS1 bacterium]|nr:hypothetical protein [candidate division WS1 bacterium]